METKEWIKVLRVANTGNVTVTVTLQCGNLVAKWSVRSFGTGIKDGVTEARRGAESALSQIEEALA